MACSVRSFAHDEPAAEEFAAWPGCLYTNDPFYRPEGDVSPHGLEARYFLVSKDGQTAGRAAALLNPAIRWRNQKTGLIAFYECIDDPGVSTALIDAALRYLRDRGCAWAIGPLNRATWYKYRFTLPDNQPPFFLDNYHKPWYVSQFVGAGFEPIAGYCSSRVTDIGTDPTRIQKFEKRFADRGVSIRGVEMSAFENELGTIHDISVAAFRDNFLYTPIGVDEFQRLYEPVKPLVDPSFVLIAHDSHSRGLAFIFGVPDLYDGSGTTLVIKTVATRPVPQARGLGALLVEKLHHTARERGFGQIIHALMHENNMSTRILGDRAGGFRSYNLYARKL